MQNKQTRAQGDQGFITRVVSLFLRSRLSIVLILLSLALGIAALIFMPKEEDPQIVVPMADVIISAPGASAQEVDNLVTTPLEKLLWQIKGVEDVYAISRDGQAVVTVKFYVGTDQEQALVRLHSQIQMHLDEVPSLVSHWLVKPVTINDVPIVNIVLYSEQYNSFQLHQIGQEVLTQLSQLPNISKTYLIGGQSKQARIIFDPLKLAGYGLTPLKIYQAIQTSNVSLLAGTIDNNNHQIDVKTDAFIENPQQLGDLIVAVHNHEPVFLKDVAKVIYGPSEINHYTNIGFSTTAQSPQSNLQPFSSYPAVTIALAKKSGTNAVTVANTILTKLATLKQTLIPQGVHVKITRNYGESAHDKVDELLYSLGLAILTVIIVLIIFLGWRESMIVAVSVPISFALALFVDYLFGYSINRVTLFALILSLGLVVDDPITNVENIQRHLRMSKASLFTAVIHAVNEVLPPVIMASLTIIVSFLPLFFISGMMGPYMSPMAATVPLTIAFSTIASLTIVPWMAYKFLGYRNPPQPIEHSSQTRASQVTSDWIRTGYRKLINPFLSSRSKRYWLLLTIIAALGGCAGMVFLKAIPLQLLPFDNKNVLQLVIDMPEGTPLEQTARTVDDLEAYLKTSPYVDSFTAYVGTPAPMDFNGMVRHYYLRAAANQAIVDVQLLPKDQRALSSHEISLVLRRGLTEIAHRNHAKLAIVETPPGPPVMQTVVAQVSGTPSMRYDQIIQAAKQVKSLLAQEPLVVDINDSTQAPRKDLSFVVNKEKVALNGITPLQIAKTLKLALGETTPLIMHEPNQRTPVNIYFEVPRQDRTSALDLSALTVKAQNGNLVPLIALGHFQKVDHNQPIFQKNLQRVVYVYANTAGRPPANVILSLEDKLSHHPLPAGIQVNWSNEGNWKITVQVFRDMGIGFAAAMLAIYILLFIQTDSFLLPLIMMLAIPLTVIGIVPGFWLLNLIANHPIDGFPTPIFFTATGMIGMIALGGIVIRNSVILVDFIDKSRQKGMSFKEAVLESGAVRLRPIFLTALTAALGAWPITMDPIFSGLAWTLIFGLFASTAFTLLVIPVTYYALYRKQYEKDNT